MDAKKLDYITDKLNEIFVDKYQIIKKSVNEINQKLKELGVNFEYQYDDFCLEYKKEMIDIINQTPELELNDLTLFMISHSILLKMLGNKRYSQNLTDSDKSVSQNLFL